MIRLHSIYSIIPYIILAVSKSGMGTWGLGLGNRDLGMWDSGCGTQELGDWGLWDVGHGDSGTCGDSGM